MGRGEIEGRKLADCSLAVKMGVSVLDSTAVFDNMSS